jgi:hypothetical protein
MMDGSRAPYQELRREAAHEAMQIDATEHVVVIDVELRGIRSA